MCSELIFTSIFMFKQIVESHAVNLWGIDCLYYDAIQAVFDE